MPGSSNLRSPEHLAIPLLVSVPCSAGPRIRQPDLRAAAYPLHGWMGQSPGKGPPASGAAWQRGFPSTLARAWRAAFAERVDFYPSSRRSEEQREAACSTGPLSSAPGRWCSTKGSFPLLHQPRRVNWLHGPSTAQKIFILPRGLAPLHRSFLFFFTFYSRQLVLYGGKWAGAFPLRMRREPEAQICIFTFLSSASAHHFEISIGTIIKSTSLDPVTSASSAVIILGTIQRVARESSEITLFAWQTARKR